MLKNMTDVRFDLLMSWVFGALLLVCQVGVTIFVVFGKPDESTSKSLEIMLGPISTVFGVWANSKFGAHNRAEPTASVTSQGGTVTAGATSGPQPIIPAPAP